MIPFTAAHTYIAHIWLYPPPPPGEQSTRVTKKLAAKTVDEDHAGAKPPLKSVIYAKFTFL